MSVKTLEGMLTKPEGKKRFTLIASRFNAYMVDSLVSGAVDALIRQGIPAEDITVIRCPGAYELPLIAKRVASRRGCDAIIALGAIIRGGTAHFDYIAGECSKGLADVMMTYSLPVSFGVLTVDSIEQAIERSGSKMGNKGTEAAMAALEMVNLFSSMEEVFGE